MLLALTPGFIDAVGPSAYVLYGERGRAPRIYFLMFLKPLKKYELKNK
jgi:hypothetical protein